MKSRLLFLSFSLLFTLLGFSQEKLNVQVIDSITGENIYGVKVFIEGTSNGGVSDEDGNVQISGIPNTPFYLLCKAHGFHEKRTLIQVPAPKKLIVRIVPEQLEVDEIIVEASRANRSISNLPTRTEILTEEIDEAASMEPSKISHLITHSTGIQVQTTAASSNGAVVRIQGLNGRYTQLLKDGFPLYGGFSGSLDILQIPPLDLRQVEYIKGSASTLYGGGAIGGLINLLSKKGDRDEVLLHMNGSHIGARDFNAFASKKFGKFGFTNLASFHLHKPYDADKDGYSDIPDVSKFNFNPKLFYYPDDRSEIYFGANISKETRNAGDMSLLNGAESDSSHFYADRQKSTRYTSQFSASHQLGARSMLKLKNSVSSFQRSIRITPNRNEASFTRFQGTQLNSFSEFSFSYQGEKHFLSTGVNLYTDRFREEHADSLGKRDQSYLTGGVFINHLWDISKKLSLETGLRADHATAQSEISQFSGTPFFLPRINALYKIHRSFSIRLGGGMGYRMPTIFNEESEAFGYDRIRAIDFENSKAEQSYGGNLDFKYQSSFGSENVLLTLNQLFFYNSIQNPLLLNSDSTGALFYQSASNNTLISQGFESQIKLTLWKFTWFLGYTYTDAFLQSGSTQNDLILTPKHSIKGDLLFVVKNKWRIGWDYEYKSSQLLSSNKHTRSLFTTGVIVERTLEHFVLFLNAENFTDTRQTRYESLLSGPNQTPQFTEVWAPLDGFFFNLGLKIKFD
ncbi:MAG: TonB-dependent receptor [Bacteroidetes bacterium]|nr:MAG: TonB-dependent receptor [Bacteroidota bacterium]